MAWLALYLFHNASISACLPLALASSALHRRPSGVLMRACVRVCNTCAYVFVYECDECVWVSVHVCVHTCVQLYMWTCVCTGVAVCMRVRVPMCARVPTRLCMCVCVCACALLGSLEKLLSLPV